MRPFLRHAGLMRPYRFERTLVVLAGLALALMVGAAAVVLASHNHLLLDSPRGWHFLYLAALIAAGMAAAPWPRLAAVLLSLATIEIGLGMGSALLYKYRWASSETLFPRDYRRPPYGWHPLLQATPLPTAPEQAATARVFINSQRLRGQERAPAELSGKIVIALFGGSTTFDFISPQRQTWGERLEQLLGPGRYAVINHGGIGYSTAQNLVQTDSMNRPTVPSRAARSTTLAGTISAASTSTPSISAMPTSKRARWSIRSMPAGPPAHGCRYRRCSA